MSAVQPKSLARCKSTPAAVLGYVCGLCFPPPCRFFARPLAELITSQGRDILQSTVDLVNDMGVPGLEVGLGPNWAVTRISIAIPGRGWVDISRMCLCSSATNASPLAGSHRKEEVRVLVWTAAAYSVLCCAALRAGDLW